MYTLIKIFAKAITEKTGRSHARDRKNSADRLLKLQENKDFYL